MKTFFKVLAWIVAALVGLFIWNAFPDIQPIVMWGFAAAFIYQMVSNIVEETTRKVLWNELAELRRQSNANVERLEVIDRKVGAIWDRIREISGG